MLKLLRAFFLGLRECRGDVGMTYDNDAESPRSRAYDKGRALGCWALRIP
jgi:hypothetical protein